MKNVEENGESLKTFQKNMQLECLLSLLIIFLSIKDLLLLLILSIFLIGEKFPSWNYI